MVRVPVSRPRSFGTGRFAAAMYMPMASGWFTNNGPSARLFEATVEGRLGVPNFVAMANGTLALEAAVSRLFKPGDRIAIPSYTFVSVASAVVRCGCRPVFIDIEPHRWTMSHVDLMDRINSVDGVIVANVFGVSPDRAIFDLAEAMPVIYDNAEGFGAHTGILGTVDCYSFHATKIVNSGEGGGVACGDREWFDHWRNIGLDGVTYDASCVGTNAKMSEFHAVLGLLSLTQEKDEIQERSRLLATYYAELHDVARFQAGSPYNCVVLLDDRDSVAERLDEAGIDTRIYFYPIHHMSPYRQYTDRELPVTDSVAGQCLALPLWAGLGTDTVLRICQVVKQ